MVVKVNRLDEWFFMRNHAVVRFGHAALSENLTQSANNRISIRLSNGHGHGGMSKSPDSIGALKGQLNEFVTATWGAPHIAVGAPVKRGARGIWNSHRELYAVMVAADEMFSTC
jgi:hypothetical protein